MLYLLSYKLLALSYKLKLLKRSRWSLACAALEGVVKNFWLRLESAGLGAGGERVIRADYVTVMRLRNPNSRALRHCNSRSKPPFPLFSTPN